MHAWARTIEELKLASLDQGTRVLGIVSPLPAAGVSEVTHLIAETSHWAGARTILADLARAPDASHPELAWQAWMTLIEETGPADALNVRTMRRSLQNALANSRVTRGVVSGIAVAASDIATLVLDCTRAVRIGLRVSIAGKAVKLEIIHDGDPMRGEDVARLQGPPQGRDLISLQGENLGFALAKRTLPNWDYVQGSLHRLVGWCNLDGSTDCLLEPDDCPKTFDRIVANPSGPLRAPFNNVEQMRQLFHQELAHYTAVVVDLPSILGDHQQRINPLAPAAACDGVYVLCMAGIVDNDALTAAMKLLRQSAVNILGVVVNDAENPSLGAEIAREARRVSRLTPGLSRWLERKALAVKFLN
jgi:hypothetical protein